MIIRGTTPTVVFKVKTELDLSEIVELWITFKPKTGDPRQRDMTYTLEDVTIDPLLKTISLFMSQEDTLAFNEKPYNVQVRLRTQDDSAYASSIIEEPIGKILKDGVI